MPTTRTIFAQEQIAAAGLTGDDPEFENLINVDRLHRAWQDLDAAQLADVAIDFIVAERVLGRAHHGISVDKLFDTAIGLATQNGDRDTLDLLQEIATKRKDPSLTAKIKLSGATRSSVDSGWYEKVTSNESFNIYWHVLGQKTQAYAVGDLRILERASKLIGESTVLSDEQKSDLLEKLDVAGASIPATPALETDALLKLSGPSRHPEEIRDVWNGLSNEEKQRVIQAGLNAERMKARGGPPSQLESTVLPDDGGWTLMLYLGADSDLEAAIINNLEETIRIGSQPGVNVVVLADRHPNDEDDLDWREEPGSYTNRDVANAENWIGARVFHVEKNQLTLIKDLGEDVNTGDGKTLEDFFRLAITKFPAQRYGLIFSGHGEAWENICPDDTPEGEFLSMPEVRDAIQRGVGRPLDFLGFDACLMANFEVFQTLAPMARVVVASEETSPGDGWNYVSLLRTLAKNSRTTGLELGISVGESFEDYFLKNRGEGNDWSTDYTLSVVDMQKFEQVDRALNDLAKWLGASLASDDMDNRWLQIARAAGQSSDYGRSMKSDPREPLIDLVGFSTNLAAASADPKIQAAAKNLNSAIKSAIVFERHGEEKEGTNGMSIYLPHQNQNDLDEKLHKYAQLPLARGHSWFAVIQRATRLAAVERPVEMLGEITSSLIEEGILDIDVTVQDLDSFEYAEFALAQRVGDRLGVVGRADMGPSLWLPIEPIADELNTEWDGTWFTLNMGNQAMLCPDLFTDDPREDEGLLYVGVQVARRGRDHWMDIDLEFQYEFGSAEFLGASVSDHGEVKEVHLKSGDRLRPVIEVIDANGETNWQPSVRGIITVTDPEQLVITMKPIPAGNFLVGYIVHDLNGNAHPKFVEIQK